MTHSSARVHHRSLLMRAVGAGFTAVLISACSPWTGPFDGYYRTGEDQPWGFGVEDGGAGKTCTPRPDGSVLTSSSYGLSNDTGGDLTLDHVQLVKPRGLRLTEAGVFEVAKYDGYFLLPGVTSGFPPTGQKANQQAVGRTFEAAPGAVVPPHDDERQSYALAVGLRLDGAGAASFESIEVEYHDDQGRAYRSRLGSTLELLPQGEKSCF
ncbi:hypothetical protein [Solicola sp. PLA-1-18]|uniref:hypothetical protein n=1 Tax=Solicola sp. PLA-1-18 TaxID=3380532 RepID=UPI003B76F537